MAKQLVDVKQQQRPPQRLFHYLVDLTLADAIVVTLVLMHVIHRSLVQQTLTHAMKLPVVLLAIDNIHLNVLTIRVVKLEELALVHRCRRQRFLKDQFDVDVHVV